MIEESVAWVKNRIAQLRRVTMAQIMICYAPRHRVLVQARVDTYLDGQITPNILRYVDRALPDLFENGHRWDRNLHVVFAIIVQSVKMAEDQTVLGLYRGFFASQLARDGPPHDYGSVNRQQRDLQALVRDP